MDFALQTAGSYDEVLAAAQWAAACDMVAIAVPDHSPRGSYEQVAEQVSMLAGLGAERFYVQ